MEYIGSMDKSQADAIAQAILEPDLKSQKEIRIKRVQEAEKLASQRRNAGFVLIGGVFGAAIGHFAFGSISYSWLIGAFVGLLASAFFGRIHGRDAA